MNWYFSAVVPREIVATFLGYRSPFLAFPLRLFDDAESKKILENLLIAMDDKSPSVVIADAVAGEVNIDPIIASMDMQMLMGTRGRERTVAEWRSLFDVTGFEI